MLASFASHPLKSYGRFIAEVGEDMNYRYLKDRARIIHSVAFRRLEYKTQVFVNYAGDHYRTRLTHTLEVAQIARTIARYLNLNEDLSEAIALCHDVGHPPFGHAGEAALNQLYTGFDHNLHAIKIITKLEHRHAEFKGLNLSWEIIEGVVKHNGPIIGKTIPKLLQQLNDKMNLFLDKFPSLEAQVANLADDIAYIAHDIDDGIRAGFFIVEELKELPLAWHLYSDVVKQYPQLEISLLVSGLIRKISNAMVEDLVATTRYNIKKHYIESVEDVRKSAVAIVGFSEGMEQFKNRIKGFLSEKVYRNYRVNRITLKGQSILRQIFSHLLENPQCLPTEWFWKTKSLKKEECAEIICDYIAGMTDRYALEEYKKLLDLTTLF